MIFLGKHFIVLIILMGLSFSNAQPPCDCGNPTASCQCFCDSASNYNTSTFITGEKKCISFKIKDL